MDKIKKELKELGYDGHISEYSSGYSRNMQRYVLITFLKKGKSKFIKKLIDLGWEKHDEYKSFGSPSYKGYSLTIEYRKLIK